jgi:hypothetical protein
MSRTAQCPARGCVDGFLPDWSICEECNGTGRIVIPETPEKPLPLDLVDISLAVAAALMAIIGFHLMGWL